MRLRVLHATADNEGKAVGVNSGSRKSIIISTQEGGLSIRRVISFLSHWGGEIEALIVVDNDGIVLGVNSRDTEMIIAALQRGG